VATPAEGPANRRPFAVTGLSAEYVHELRLGRARRQRARFGLRSIHVRSSDRRACFPEMRTRERPLAFRSRRDLNTTMVDWIARLLTSDNELWGFVVFLATGHLAGEQRECDPVPLLIPRLPAVQCQRESGFVQHISPHRRSSQGTQVNIRLSRSYERNRLE
jgi:hypothetical protein